KEAVYVVISGAILSRKANAVIDQFVGKIRDCLDKIYNQNRSNDSRAL
ncbi:13235_t:CDS:2, partial [Funneliformis caledonium]